MMTVILPAADYKRSKSAWLTARKAGLGASETAAVLGLDPWRTPLDVYLDKISAPSGEGSVGEAAEWGSAIEAVVARKVASRHPELGRLIPSPGLCQHPDHPWMLATPDRLLENRDTGELRVLEIKTTDGRNKPTWADGPPPRVLVQVQQQLAVTGLSTGYVAVLFGGREMPEPFRVDRDPQVEALIVEHAGRFWREHVQARIMPEARLGDASNLLAMFPGDPDLEPLIATPDLEELISARRRRQVTAKEAADEVEKLDVLIKQHLGDHIEAVDGQGRPLVTWKPQTSSRLDSKRLKAEHPDLAEQFTTTTTTRVLRMKDAG